MVTDGSVVDRISVYEVEADGDDVHLRRPTHPTEARNVEFLIDVYLLTRSSPDVGGNRTTRQIHKSRTPYLALHHAAADDDDRSAAHGLKICSKSQHFYLILR